MYRVEANLIVTNETNEQFGYNYHKSMYHNVEHFNEYDFKIAKINFNKQIRKINNLVKYLNNETIYQIQIKLVDLVLVDEYIVNKEIKTFSKNVVPLKTKNQKVSQKRLFEHY